MSARTTPRRGFIMKTSGWWPCQDHSSTDAKPVGRVGEATGAVAETSPGGVRGARQWWRERTGQAGVHGTNSSLPVALKNNGTSGSIRDVEQLHLSEDT
jgi:hypothetical protein